MQTGMVLEGGAMRGLFTAGVLDVMMEEKLRYDGIVGVSAGAAFGCNYKSHQIGRVLRYNTRYCRDKRYAGFRVLLKTGDFYSKDFCYGQIPEELDVFDFDTYEADPTAFYAVCTDVETGKPVYHRYDSRQDHGFEWIRASASMPMVSRMVEIDGRRYLDGGIADSIPLAFFQQAGYEKNVVVLTQPRDYRKKPNSLMPLLKIQYRKYPALLATMENRYQVYNQSLEYVHQQAAAGKAFVIQPKAPLPLKRTERDPEKLRAVYQLGRQAAQEQMEGLKAFLAQPEAE